MLKKITSNIAIYQMQANLCHALSHPIRLYILDLLYNQEMSCAQLLEQLEIPKANLSQHLAVLKETNLIKTRKKGTCQFFSIAIPKIHDACDLLKGILVDQLNEEHKSIAKIKKNLEAKAHKET
jgi:ArsR family transcriptional regulator